MAKTAKHREMDMLHGGLAGRLILFALPLGGLLYFAVDYGIFYQLLGTRTVTGADPFWFPAAFYSSFSTPQTSQSSAASQAMPRLRQWAAASRSSAFSSI